MVTMMILIVMMMVMNCPSRTDLTSSVCCRNVYYTPWKVAMGVRNLAAMHPVNLDRLACAIPYLIEGLDFDAQSRKHCSLALYEICVGHAELELQLSLHRGLRGSLVQQVIAPLVAAKQRLSWARLLCTRSHRSSSAGQDYSAAVADLALPTQPHDLLPYDLVEMVSGYVLACVVSERAVELVLEYRRGECLEYRHVGLDAFGDSAVFHSCQATAICTARS
jgi:hypothetical protein|eukprot:SAG25_NODE_121_length_14652_cov_9.937607_14_plen_221_part_00